MRGLTVRFNSKRSQGRPWAGYRAAKWVEFRGADLVLLKRRQHPPRAMACGRGASRCRRPHARGDVLCTETGRSHPCPERHAGPAHEGNIRTMSMNADEKSDEGMVPMKQPNKEGSPSAEAVEGRTSPEGNGDETTATRTLRRDTASSGLDAVRSLCREPEWVGFGGRTKACDHAFQLIRRTA